jgi:uncharacterized SAM-binding protein YcdF (DUF218 family)
VCVFLFFSFLFVLFLFLFLLLCFLFFSGLFAERILIRSARRYLMNIYNPSKDYIYFSESTARICIEGLHGRVFIFIR